MAITQLDGHRNLVIPRIKFQFCNLFEEIISRRKERFSGIGAVVYDSEKLSNLNSIKLRPSIQIPRGYSLEDIDGMSKFLIEMSSLENPLHDGFVFFNESGKFTHAAQYFAPPPIHGVNPNENYGTRYHAVLFGSYIDGVIIAGGITSGNHYYIFEKGRFLKGDSNTNEKKF